MFRSRLFRRLFGVVSLLVVLSCVVIAALFPWQLREAWRSEQAANLRSQCVLLTQQVEPLLRAGRAGDFRERLQELAQATDARLTIIAGNGNVLADSALDADSIENHIGRPEIQEASVARFGVDERVSRTVGKRMLYVAQAVRGESSADLLGFVRVAHGTEALDAWQHTVIQRVSVAAALVCACALVFAFLFARRIAAPIGALAESAKGLAEGRFDVRHVNLPSDEIGDLAEMLDRVGREVTEKIHTLSTDEGRLRAMLAGMVEGVVAVDEADRVTFSNVAARRLMGATRTALDGQRLWEALRINGLDALVAEARRDDTAAECELVLAREGGERALHAKAHRFVVEGVIGVVVVFQDVTELRRLERIRRDFVANVSHELKTPLTSIRGYVEVLLDGAIHDEQHNVAFLEKIDQNVQRLRALVSDLLSLARIESEEGAIKLHRVDVRGVIQGALRRAEDLAGAKGVTLRHELPEGPGGALADEEALTQVIDNLLDNAIKYTPEGGEVRLVVQPEGEQVEIRVTDTGVGIPSQDLERIFERFYRVDRARSRALGGTGLGLSIVKHLVQAMGGDIAVKSRIGRGSTFTVRLSRTD